MSKDNSFSILCRIIPNAEFPMTEERKFAILIAATILSARKLAELENPDKLTPNKAVRRVPVP
jgi:hypothetical protein